MKILLQNQYDRPVGGVETYFQPLVKGLLEKGHEVIVVYTFSGKKPVLRKDRFQAFYLPDLDLPEEVYYSQKRSREIKQDLLTLQSIVERERPDVIHLNNTYYPEQFSFLRKHAPLIQTVHDFFNCCPILLKMFTDEVCAMPLGINCFRMNCVSAVSLRELWRIKTKYANREAMKQFDRQLVTTEYMKEMLLRNGFEKDRIEVVPLFVEDWGKAPGHLGNTIIYVGRLAREKGVLHFIHMLKLINYPFKAYIIGEGPQRQECENLVKSMGLEGRVVFTGFLSSNELKEYFIKSSVVVIPSLWPEPFCLVGIEAMSLARPVVAYNVGGISSWLKDNYNGYLVHRADIKELAWAVEAIFKNRKLGFDMGRNGRLLFEERFTEKIHFSRLFSIYEAFVKERRAAKRNFFNIRFCLFPDRQPGNHASSRYILRHYPKRMSQEPLPEYNKRIIAHEIQNNISVVKSYPEEITISTTTRCNMDPPCVICERNERTKDDEFDLNEKVLEKIKPIFKYADRIYLHCGGEPLVTQRSYDIIESVSAPTKIIFNTNGALFTEDTIKRMVDCGVVEVISFSIDAATEATYKKIRSADFNKIIYNVKTLIEYRNKRNKDKPLLRPLVLLNFCIFRQNIYEVPDYVALTHNLGADGIDFSHMNEGLDWKQEREGYVFDYKKEHVMNMENKEDHDNQILKAYDLGKKYNLPINFNGNPFIGLLNDSKLKIKSEISELIRCEKRKCSAPWNSAVIENDGRVRVCCFHHSIYQTIGKFKAAHSTPYYAQSDTFEEIWNGEEAVSVRREFLEKGIAKRCITKNPCIFQNRI